jgi:cytochrome c-type biogenesis protein CcmF
MWFGVTIMAVAAALICLGTSWPLISRWSWLHAVPGLSGVTGSEGVRVEPVFYNRLGAVLVIPTLFVLGSVPFLAWSSTDADAFMRRMMLPWLLAIAGGTVVLWFVLHEATLGFHADTPRAVTVAIGTLGLFAAFANGFMVVKTARRRLLKSGGWLAHCGVGLLLLGTIIANVYEKTESYAVVEGREPMATAFGYTLGFAGWTHDGKPEDQILRDWTRHDHAVLIRVGFPLRRGHGRGYVARVAVFKYWDAASNDWHTMTWPDIHRQIHRDIYLAAADDPKLIRPSATLRPGETATIGTAGMPPTGYSVRYNRFFGSGHGRGMSSPMAADMTLFTPDKRAIRIRPGISFSEGSPTPVNVAIPEIGGAAVLDGGISPGSKELTVVFELPGAPARWVVPVAATNKPLMGFVWLGATLIILGSALAMLTRATETHGVSAQGNG